MIGIDTNVLLRYVLRDDPRQSATAIRFVDETCQPERPGVVHPVVLCEMWWTLNRHWKVTKDDLVATLSALLAHPHLTFHDIETVAAAIAAYSRGRADFPDYIILLENRRFGAPETVTFDRNASASGHMTALA